MTETKAVAVEQPAQLAVTPSATRSVLQQAITAGAPVDVIERLIGLVEREDAKDAKRAFESAFLAAKQQLDGVKITKRGTITYEGKPGKQGGSIKFMRYDDIADVVKPILAEHGLTASYSYEYIATPPKVVCVLTLRHSGGHSEQFHGAPLPMIDGSGGKSDVQGVGSTMTYGRRYAIQASFDIVAEGEDTDGSGKAAIIQEAALLELDDMLAECENKEAGAKARAMAWVTKEFRVAGLSELTADQGGRVKSMLAKKLGGK